MPSLTATLQSLLRFTLLVVQDAYGCLSVCVFYLFSYMSVYVGLSVFHIYELVFYCCHNYSGSLLDQSELESAVGGVFPESFSRNKR